MSGTATFHRPRLVVSHSTCSTLLPPHANSFVIDPAVIKHTHLSDDQFARVSSELNQYLTTGSLECSPCQYKEYAFEITATWAMDDLGVYNDWGGFAEVQFYDCSGTQLVPSSWSNPGGNHVNVSHAPALAFDGNLDINWLDLNKQPIIATFSTAVRVATYKCITASDASNEPGRNPTSWKLKARS